MTPQEFALNALQSTPVSAPTAMSRAMQRRRSSYSPAEESLRQLYGLPTYEQGVEEGQPSDQVIEQVSRPAIAPPPEYTPSNKERAVNLAVGAIGAIANPLDVPRGVVSNLLGQGSMMIAPEGYQLKNLGGLHSPVISPFTQEGRVEGRELLRKWGIADRYRDTYGNFWGGIGLELATDPLTYINPFAGMTRAGVRLAGIGLGKKAIRESANNLALKAAKTKGKVLGKQMGGKASRFAMTPKTVIENLTDETQQVVAKRDWLIAKGDLSHGDLISQLPEGTTQRGKTYEDLVWDEQVAIIDSRWKEITNKANDKYDALLDEPVGQWGDIGLPFMQPWKSIGSGQAPDKYMEKWVEKNLADPPRGAPSPGTGGPPPASGGTGPTQGPGGPSGGGPQGTPPTTGPVPSGPHTPPSGGAPGGQAAPTTPDPNSFLQRWARNENIPQQEIDDHVKSVAAAIASGRQGTDPLDVQFYRENSAAIEAELHRLAQSQITPPASGIPPVVTPPTPPPLGLDDYVSIPQRGAIRPVEGFIEDIVTGRKALIRDAQGNITTRTVPPSAVQTPPSQLPNTARQRGIEQIKLAAASVSGVTPEQAPRLASAVTSVMDALTDSIARRSGKSPEDVWGQLEWKVAPDDLTDRAKKSGGLPQDYAGKVYGQFTWDNGKGIIELDKIANATTFLHEPGHFVEKMLPHLGKNFEEIVKQHFSTKGVFDSEAFARAFEVYMHQGTMPANATAKLKEAFKSIRDLVVDIYRKIVSGDKATAALLASQAHPKTQKIIQAIFDDATLKELQKAPKPTPTNKVIDDVTRSRKAPPAQPRPATAAAGVSNAELANVDVEIGQLEGIARDINKASLNSTYFIPDEIARRANRIAAARELIARIETPGLKAELSTRLDAAESTINARFAELNAKQAKEFVKQPTPKPQTSTVDTSSIIKESPQGVVVNRFLKSASLKADDPRFRVKLSSGVEGVGQRYGNLAVAKFADEADKPYSALAHIPTGMIITADGTITEQKQLAKLINAAELDMSFTDPKAATSETIAKLKALGYAWKHNDYSKLPEDVVELLARKTDMNQVKESSLVVDANYLSGTHSHTEYAKTSTPLIKSLAKEVPEFSYNPVMTVADDGSLVYKDHYEYRFSQTALLPKGVELSPGQTVAFNLQDFGIKTVSDEASVVQNALRNAGFTVRKTADGLAASLGDQKVKVTGSGNQWKVSGQGGEVDALAERVVNGIAWNQPPQGGPQFQAQKIPLSAFTEKAKAAAAAGRQKLKAGMDAIVGPDASMIIADAMDSVTARVTRNPGIAAIIGLFDRKVLDQLKPTVQVHAERLYDAMMEAERHANREAASVEHALIKSGFLDIKPLMDSGLTESQAVKVLQDRNRAVVNFFEFAFHQPDASIALTVDEIQAEIAKLTDQLKIIRKEERAAIKAGDQARVDATAERAAQLENAIDVQQDNLTKRYREERVEANRLMAEAELERLGMGSIRSLLVDMIEIKDEAFNHALVAGYDPTALTDLYVEHWGRYAKKAGKQFLRDPNKGRPLDNIGEVMQRSFRNIAGGRATVNEMSIDPILSGIVHREPVGNDKIRPLVDSATGEILADAMPPLRDHIARTYGKDLIADFDPSTIGKPGGFDPATNTIFDSIIRELANLDAYHAEKQFPLFGHSFMEDFLMYIKNVHRAAYTTEIIQKIVADNIGSPELFAAIRAEAASELMQRYMKDIDNLVEYAEATQDIDRGRSISKAFRDIKLKSPIAWQRTLDAVQAKQPEYYAIYQKWLETALNAHAVKLAENGKTVVNSIGEGAVTFSIQEDTGRLLRTRIINVPWEGLGPIPKDYKGSRKVTEVAGPNDWDELIKQEAQFRFLDSYGINKDLEKLLTVWRKGWQDPEALHPALLAYDGLLTLWKTSMTGLWPAFHSRNTISAVFNNWLFGASDPTVSGHKKYLQPYVDMHHLLNGEVIPGIEKLPRFRGMTAEQATDLIRQEIFAHHVIGTKQGLSVEALNESFAAVEAIIPGATQTNAWPFLGKVKLVPKPSDATTADRLNPFASRGSLGWSKDQGWFTYRDNYGDWARWGQTAAQQTEKMVRGAAFIAYLKQGDSFASAAEKVARNHVDYSRLSGFERKVMRRIFPFYNWTRWMAPTIWQNLYENPGGKLANTLRIINRSRSDDPGTPDQILDTASIPLGESADGGQRYLTNFGFAFEEPVNLLGGILQLDPTQITQDIASRSLPLKFITEVASGRSMYFKGPGGYGQDLEQLDPPIGRTIQNIRDIVTGERTQDATPLGSVKFEHFLSQLPTSRAVNTVRTITDKRKWDNPTDLILNTLTGVRVRDVSANALDRNYQQRIMEDLKAHGAREFRRTYVPDTKLEALDTESRDAVDAMLDELKIIDRRFRSRREAEAEAKKVVQEGRILKQFITSGE